MESTGQLSEEGVVDAPTALMGLKPKATLRRRDVLLACDTGTAVRDRQEAQSPEST